MRIGGFRYAFPGAALVLWLLTNSESTAAPSGYAVMRIPAEVEDQLRPPTDVSLEEDFPEGLMFFAEIPPSSAEVDEQMLPASISLTKFVPETPSSPAEVDEHSQPVSISRIAFFPEDPPSPAQVDEEPSPVFMKFVTEVPPSSAEVDEQASPLSVSRMTFVLNQDGGTEGRLSKGNLDADVYQDGTVVLTANHEQKAWQIVVPEDESSARIGRGLKSVAEPQEDTSRVLDEMDEEVVDDVKRERGGAWKSRVRRQEPAAAPGFLDTIRDRVPFDAMNAAVANSTMVMGTFQMMMLPGSSATDAAQQMQGFFSNMPQIPGAG